MVRFYVIGAISHKGGLATIVITYKYKYNVIRYHWEFGFVYSKDTIIYNNYKQHMVVGLLNLLKYYNFLFCINSERYMFGDFK